MNKFKPDYLRESVVHVLDNIGRDSNIVAAEIGVCKGEHASTMVYDNLNKRKINFKELVLVDITNNKEWLSYINSVVSDFPCIKFLNIPSVQAASKFPDEHFDFIYVDGDHSFEGVKSDLEAWQNKIKKGGFFCGHDYDKVSSFSVNIAVDGFAANKGAEVIKMNTEFVMKRTW